MPDILFRVILLIAFVLFIVSNYALFNVVLDIQKTQTYKQRDAVLCGAGFLAALSWSAFGLICRAVWL